MTAAATLALVAAGGLVTSHGAGLAVPDWPNTYGYNLFLFPVSQWVGGIFYEHTHRLLAAAVGLLTTVLAAWLWVRETRGRERWLGLAAMVAVIMAMGVRRMPVYVVLAACAPVSIGLSVWRIRMRPAELRWWGLVAFAAVILQGVLGGLRVVLIQDPIGILHAALAQLFFALTCALALMTSRRWAAGPGGQPCLRDSFHSTLKPSAGNAAVLSAVPSGQGRGGRWARLRWRSREAADGNVRAPVVAGGWRGGVFRLRALLIAATALIFLQLVIGATMRHQHAGLAIPDFPLAYGKPWPATDAASVALYNQHRLEVTAVNPITAFQIVLQMVHRLVAVCILVAVGYCAWLARKPAGAELAFLRRGTFLWLSLILVQVGLGAATIWSGKAADVATAHVVIGALSLATGVMLSLRNWGGELSDEVSERLTAARQAWAGPLMAAPASAATAIK